MHTGPEPIHQNESSFLLPLERLEDLQRLLARPDVAATRDSWCQLYLDTAEDAFLRDERSGEGVRSRVVLRSTGSQPGVVLDVGRKRGSDAAGARWWIPTQSWSEVLHNPESPLAGRFRKLDVVPRVAVRGSSAFWFAPGGRVEVMVELVCTARAALDLDPGEAPWLPLELRTQAGEPAVLVTTTGSVDLGDELPLEPADQSLYARARRRLEPAH